MYTAASSSSSSIRQRLCLRRQTTIVGTAMDNLIHTIFRRKPIHYCGDFHTHTFVSIFSWCVCVCVRRMPVFAPCPLSMCATCDLHTYSTHRYAFRHSRLRCSRDIRSAIKLLTFIVSFVRCYRCLCACAHYTPQMHENRLHDTQRPTIVLVPGSMRSQYRVPAEGRTKFRLQIAECVCKCACVSV